MLICCVVFWCDLCYSSFVVDVWINAPDNMFISNTVLLEYIIWLIKAMLSFWTDIFDTVKNAVNPTVAKLDELSNYN